MSQLCTDKFARWCAGKTTPAWQRPSRQGVVCWLWINLRRSRWLKHRCPKRKKFFSICGRVSWSVGVLGAVPRSSWANLSAQDSPSPPHSGALSTSDPHLSFHVCCDVCASHCLFRSCWCGRPLESRHPPGAWVGVWGRSGAALPWTAQPSAGKVLNVMVWDVDLAAPNPVPSVWK